jgi:sugar O-acyltransferase (sialic acid O-acetyltransferase NeuD family)
MNLILIGAGGHGRVVLDAVRTRSEYHVVGFIDIDPTITAVEDVPVLGGDEVFETLSSRNISHGLVTLGATGPSSQRQALFKRMRGAGLEGAIVVHRDATVAASSQLGEGTVVLAGAVVNPGARIGQNVIVNTGAIVEHDCTIGDHAHLSPGAVLGGGVQVGDRAHVGIGATVIQGIRIGADALVAGGAVVITDVPAGARVAGVPAKPMPPGRALTRRHGPP